MNTKDLRKNLVMVNYRNIERAKLLKSIDENIEKDRKLIIYNLLNCDFKIRGIHAQLADYSFQQNVLSLKPKAPDCGVDQIHLSFAEFEEEVIFIGEEEE